MTAKKSATNCADGKRADGKRATKTTFKDPNDARDPSLFLTSGRRTDLFARYNSVACDMLTISLKQELLSG